jgi:hypothetical protein
MWRGSVTVSKPPQTNKAEAVKLKGQRESNPHLPSFRDPLGYRKVDVEKNS